MLVNWTATWFAQNQVTKQTLKMLPKSGSVARLCMMDLRLKEKYSTRQKVFNVKITPSDVRCKHTSWFVSHLQYPHAPPHVLPESSSWVGLLCYSCCVCCSLRSSQHRIPPPHLYNNRWIYIACNTSTQGCVVCPYYHLSERQHISNFLVDWGKRWGRG